MTESGQLHTEKTKILSLSIQHIRSYTPLLQVPEDLHKLKKTLSDKTKRKIAENNRKFSVCKLCRWKS